MVWCSLLLERSSHTVLFQSHLSTKTPPTPCWELKTAAVSQVEMFASWVVVLFHARHWMDSFSADRETLLIFLCHGILSYNLFSPECWALDITPAASLLFSLLFPAAMCLFVILLLESLSIVTWQPGPCGFRPVRTQHLLQSSLYSRWRDFLEETSGCIFFLKVILVF